MIMVTRHHGSVLIVGGSAGSSLLAEPPSPESTSPSASGTACSMEPITIDVGDCHSLTVGMVLRLRAATTSTRRRGWGAARGPCPSGEAVREALAGVLSRHTPAELAAPAARAVVQEELAASLRRSSRGEVLEVSFEEFVLD